MADLDFTSANVRNASPVGMSLTTQLIAGVAISAGQAVYINSSGNAALADASAADTAVAIGIALETVSIGQTAPILVYGFCYGFDLSALAYNVLVSVSDTAGDLDNGSGSPTVAAPVGRVWALTDAARSKVLFVNCAYNLCVLPA
jgi:hypothetical protein